MPGYYSASQIDSKRWSKSQLQWTADKFLKGAGAGADPIEVDAPGAGPSGLIAMWHGLIANIPSGWVICDGNNSTPNLLAKFIEGVATAATNPGATGGATSKTTGAPSATYTDVNREGTNSIAQETHTHTIADIRPSYFDVAFIMKT